MRTIVAASSLALLLFASSTSAVVPFSWSPDRPTPLSPTDTVDVPEGMIWIVEFASGYSRSDLIAVLEMRQVTNSPNLTQTLYIAPDVTAVAGDFGTDVLLQNYNQLLVARYQHTVEARWSGTDLPPRVSIIGHLTPALAGDFNGDGALNAADYTTWRDQPAFWGVADYDSWAVGYGKTDSSSQSLTVPEPAIMTVALLCLVLTGVYRRRVPGDGA